MILEHKLRKLDDLFGSYKAEWLNERIFRFFAEPSYFNALKSYRPCVLIGGRGTGKTTVLRGLSYQGQFALNHDDINQFDENQFVGIYFRCDTNHVHAFQGKGISKEKWIEIFAHYFNLILTSEILYFIDWHKKNMHSDEVLDSHACRLIATSLHLDEKVVGFDSLIAELELAMYKFQADVNNIADGNMPQLSLAGDPIKIVTEQAQKLTQFKGKIFYLLIDEYENLLDEQQQVVNTLLKHTPPSYTFKIGVREMGWRIHYTLNPQELVNDPADYVRFNIVEMFTGDTSDQFESFARDVCQLRIKNLMEGEEFDYNIEDALVDITMEDEALLLGVERHHYFLEVVDLEKQKNINLDISSLYKFFLSYWSHAQGEILEDVINDFRLNRSSWNTRYDNYKYSLLFKIKSGRGSGGIQKYYSGWRTFVKLANGNIRYLMELVYRSYYLYLQENGDLDKPVPPKVQTNAAYKVGWKNLTELEGTWKNGAQLTRLVQSIGTIFGHMAKLGRVAPEVDQFEIEDSMTSRTEELLSAGVMNLALVRLSTNKQTGNSSVKEFMYMLHPIFAPYFTYSYRRKRKMMIKNSEFLECVDHQKEAVASILKKKNINVESEKAIPMQLSFDFIEDND